MLKQYHILNGDCLFKIFPKNLQGEIIIWREALIDGPVSRDNFFQDRERFISENYSAEGNYSEMVLKEFEKISNISENEKVFLWFEEDAFCQVNLWFLLAEIQHREIADHTHWNFDQTFRIFSKKFPQYGLGDLQFKTFFDKIRP